MILPGRDILVVNTDLIQATHGNHRLLHAFFHSGNHCCHGHQAGDPKHNPEHREKGAEFVRPNVLETDKNGIEKIHRWTRAQSYLRA